MSRPRGVRQEARGQRRVEEEENEDEGESKVSRTRRVQDQGKFKIKAGSRLEQGSREIHKLFAKELKLWENSPLYIVRKEEAVHRAASMTNRRSSADKFSITDYQFQFMRTAAMLVRSHHDK